MDTDDWPRVTGSDDSERPGILHTLGFLNKGPWLHSRYLRRGRLVDWICGRIAMGRPIPDSWWNEGSGHPPGHPQHDPKDYVAHSECIEYVDAFRKALAIHAPTVLGVQVEVIHRTLRYIGHIDQVWEWKGRIWVIDLKCGEPAGFHPLQLALYADAWTSQTGDPTPLRANLYLPSGKFIERNEAWHLVNARTEARAYWIKQEYSKE